MSEVPYEQSTLKNKPFDLKSMSKPWDLMSSEFNY